MADVVTNAPTHAGVIAPPPLIAAATVVLGLGLDRVLPAYVLTVLLSLPLRLVLALLLASVGGAHSSCRPRCASAPPERRSCRGGRRRRW
jgi:hypothetical protein